MVGVAVIVGILIVVPDDHQSLSYVFTETVNNSGFAIGESTLLRTRSSGSCSASDC